MDKPRFLFGISLSMALEVSGVMILKTIRLAEVPGRDDITKIHFIYSERTLFFALLPPPNMPNELFLAEV